MLEQIKESLAQFQKEKGTELSLRDNQGIAKINSELGLLAERHEKEPVKVSSELELLTGEGKKQPAKSLRANKHGVI
jgi:hypothetical protein